MAKSSVDSVNMYVSSKDSCVASILAAIAVIIIVSIIILKMLLILVDVSKFDTETPQ